MAAGVEGYDLSLSRFYGGPGIADFFSDLLYDTNVFPVDRDTAVAVDAGTVAATLSDYDGSFSGWLDRGSSDDFWTTPDHASLDITGDIDLRCRFVPTGIANAGEFFLVGKVGVTDAYALYWSHNPDNPGFATVLMKASAFTAVFGSLESDGFAFNYQRPLWVRATVDVNDGLGNFVGKLYYSTDEGGTWTTINTYTIPGPISFASTADSLYVGSIEGTFPTFPICRVEVRDGIGGTLAASADFVNDPLNSASTSFTDGSGKVWTRNALDGGTLIVPESATVAVAITDSDTGAAVDAGESIAAVEAISSSDTGTATDTEGSLIVGAVDPETGTGVETEAVAASLTDAESGAGVEAGTIAAAITDAELVMEGAALTGVGTTSFVSAPDSTAWNIAGVMRVTVRMTLEKYAPPNRQWLVSHWGSLGDQSWAFGLAATNALNFWTSANGISTPVFSTSGAAGLVDGTTYWLGVEYNTTTGALTYYKAADQLTEPTLWSDWTVISTGTVATTVFFDSTAVLTLGAISTGSEPPRGIIHRASIYDDGVLIANPDFSSTGVPLVTPGGSSYTDSVGVVWTPQTGTRFIGAFDAGESIAATTSDADTGSATDTEGAVGVTISDTDPATVLDAEAVAASTADDDTATADDAGETLAAAASDTESATADDAGESLAATLSDDDTGTAVDDGENIVVVPAGGTPISDSDTGAATDDAAVAASTTDLEAASAVDAESLSAGISTTDTASAVDAEALDAAVTSNDPAIAGDTAAIDATLSDADTGTSSDAADTSIGTSDADTGSAADAEVSIGAAISDADLGVAVEAAAIIAALTDSDFGTALDEVLSLLRYGPSGGGTTSIDFGGVVAVVTVESGGVVTVEAAGMTAQIEPGAGGTTRITRGAGVTSTVT